jgi:hypothetical protein
MPNLHISKLCLDIPGLSPDAARRLAQLIAEQLGARAPAGLRGGERIVLELPAESSGFALERLADRITTELLRKLD